MEKFSVFVNNVDSLVWSMVLVVLCLGVGLYLSIRLKFPQVRLMKEMIHLLMDKEESENGITPFQAFATTVGAVLEWEILPVLLLRFFTEVRVLYSGCG